MAFVVPTVDLESWWEGDAAARAAVGAAFDAAASEVGFVQIVGHRIPAQVIAEMVTASDAFFARPLHEKLATRPSNLDVNRGYAASGTEALSYSIGDATPPDLFEAFNIGEDAVDHADPFYAAERQRLFAPNIWPAEPAGLRRGAGDLLRRGAPRRARADRRVRRRARTARAVVPSVRRALDDDDAHDQLRALCRCGRSAARPAADGRPHRLRRRHRAVGRRAPPASDPRCRRPVARRGARRRCPARQPRRSDRRVDERPMAFDVASRGAARARRARRSAAARRSSSTPTGTPASSACPRAPIPITRRSTRRSPPAST